MDTQQVAAAIANLEFIGKIPEDNRKQIAEVFLDVADVLHYEDGEAMINEGYLSFDTGLVLVQGTAVLEFEGKDPIEVKAPLLLGEMAQFKTADIRSATVRSKGATIGVQFYWQDLYTSSGTSLAPEALKAFQQAIEAQGWQRFEHKEIMNLPLLSSLPEPLREKVCRPLSTLTEAIQLNEVDTLFNQGAFCKSMGYLIVEGKVKLLREHKQDIDISAPNILGIFPNKAEKGTEWSATVMANGQSTILKFSWDLYTDALVKSLTPEEQQAYIASLKTNGAKHFWH